MYVVSLLVELQSLLIEITSNSSLFLQNILESEISKSSELFKLLSLSLELLFLDGGLGES